MRRSGQESKIVQHHRHTTIHHHTRTIGNHDHDSNDTDTDDDDFEGDSSTTATASTAMNGESGGLFVRTASLPLHLSTPARNRLATVGLLRSPPKTTKRTPRAAAAAKAKGSWKRLLMSSLDRCNRCMTMARPLLPHESFEGHDHDDDDDHHAHHYAAYASASSDPYSYRRTSDIHEQSPYHHMSSHGPYHHGGGHPNGQQSHNNRRKKPQSRQTVPVAECSGCSLRWCVTPQMERWLSYVTAIGFVTSGRSIIALPTTTASATAAMRAAAAPVTTTKKIVATSSGITAMIAARMNRLLALARAPSRTTGSTTSSLLLAQTPHHHNHHHRNGKAHNDSSSGIHESRSCAQKCWARCLRCSQLLIIDGLPRCIRCQPQQVCCSPFSVLLTLIGLLFVMMMVNI
jgi:hypothetical protein